MNKQWFLKQFSRVPGDEIEGVGLQMINFVNQAGLSPGEFLVVQYLGYGGGDFLVISYFAEHKLN